MNRKIAIPLENGVLSQHFGHCQKFAIVEVVNNQITDIVETTPQNMFRVYIHDGWPNLE